MTKLKLMTAAAAGTYLLAACQGYGQLAYAPGDLLLNFRNIANVNPVSGLDLIVDAGSISTIQGYTSTTVLVSSSLVQNAFGSAPGADTPIGLTACANSGVATDQTLYLSRVDSTPGQTPTNQSVQQFSSTQQIIENDINNIGAYASGVNATSVGANAVTVPAATTGQSFQAIAEENNTAAGQAVINFGSAEPIGPSRGGPLEIIQGSTTNVYSVLWKVPVGTSTSASDTYLGYLTFKPSGEVDFTPASANQNHPATPTVVGIVNNGDGTITATFQGTPGATYWVSVSTNLAQPSWTQVLSTNAPLSGTWTYTESTAGSVQRYFAGVLPPQ